jgi:PEP-CTERM motif
MCLSLCAAAAAILFSPQASRAGIIAESTFDTGLDGWTSNTPSQISWSKTGGNTGGFILFEDETNDWTVVNAPSAFLGNYTALNGVGTISFDHKIIAETGIQSLSPYEIDLSGPGGSATWTGATPKGVTGWVTLNVPLVKSDWTINSGTWNGLLANVTQLQIPVELVTNDTIPGDTDHEGIDNVILSSSAPEPTSLTLIGSGIAGIGGLSMRRRRAANGVATA